MKTKLEIQNSKLKIRNWKFALALAIFGFLFSSFGFSQGTITGAGTLTGAGTAKIVSSSTARNFNGTSSDHLSRTSTTSLESPTTALTVGLWLRLTSVTQVSWNSLIWKQGQYAAGYYYYIQQSSASVGRYVSGIATSAGATSTGAAAATMSQGTWYFLVLRWASGGYVNLDTYNHDGSLFSHIASAATNAGTITYTYHTPLSVGDATTYTGGVNGDIAQVYIDNTSLSDPDVQTLMAGTQPHAASAGYWLLGRGSPDPDSSGNGNDLTVNGTTIVAGPQ